MKLLDTSVAIDHLRDRSQATDLILRYAATGELAASELVRFELMAGVLPGELHKLERLFETLEWFGLDEAIARTGAALAQSFRRSHSGIDDVDYLIAATALVHEAELLTTNVRHFPMLDGLTPAY